MYLPEKNTEILLESIRHCQKEKGLILYSWYIMSNHIHLIVSAKKRDTSDILRDFRNSPVNELLQLYKTISRKAERSKCWKCLKGKGQRTAETLIISFGGRITKPKNVKQTVYRSEIGLHS